MYADVHAHNKINQRVRAILLTGQNTVLFIKRVKPNGVPPYWVAPGGGVEDCDTSLHDTLHRELSEELGARAHILGKAFVLRHIKADKNLEEHFFVCRLIDYDLSLRHGPEFQKPEKGLYLPDEVLLDEISLRAINIKTPEITDWIIDNLDDLRRL